MNQQKTRNWDRVKKNIVERWDKMSIYDIDEIKRNPEVLPLKIAERYTFSPDEAKEKADEFWATMEGLDQTDDQSIQKDSPAFDDIPDDQMSGRKIG